MITATYVVLALAGAGFLFRLLAGPSLPDRVVAIEGMVVTGLAAIAVRAMQSGDGAFLPVLVVLTLVGFVGTAASARFLERRD